MQSVLFYGGLFSIFLSMAIAFASRISVEIIRPNELAKQQALESRLDAQVAGYFASKQVDRQLTADLGADEPQPELAAPLDEFDQEPVRGWYRLAHVYARRSPLLC